MKHLILNIQDEVATVTLNRPELSNAFDPILIEELTAVFRDLAANDGVRVAVLRGAGKNFCAGADLNWMKESIQFKKTKNILDSLALHAMFLTVYRFPKPLIAVTQGAAFGGGVGLLACSDIVVASSSSFFCLSEVRLGIVPAIIAPFVIRKMGPSMFRALAMSGKKFSADEALKCTLVHEVTNEENMEPQVKLWINHFMQNSPQAMASLKQLLWEIDTKNISFSKGKTVRAIAKARTSREGQEGLVSFLEKRDPFWKKER